MIDTAQWQIGDGKGVAVIGQPWYQGWNTGLVPPRVRAANGNLCVADLYDQQTKQWRKAEILNILGPEALHHIEQLVRKPIHNPVLHARLIWLPGKKGGYTVKEGYGILSNNTQVRTFYPEQKLRALQEIWKWKKVIPRILMFIWRAIQGGLTTTQELARRMGKISPICPRCGQENEFVMHLLFFCPVSRRTWFVSQLALKVDALPLEFASTILMITEILKPDQIVLFCNILWELWKARNEEVFSGKKQTPQLILKKASSIHQITTPQKANQTNKTVEKCTIPKETRVILSDGSWDNTQGSSMGMAVYNKRGDLVYVKYKKVVGRDPFHAEAESIWETLLYVMQSGQDEKFHIFSDCQNLVRAILDKQSEGLPAWRAAETVTKIWRYYHTMKHRIQILYISRSAIQTPHNLATWARRSGKEGEGTPIQCQIAHLQLHNHLDKRYFVIG